MGALRIKKEHPYTLCQLNAVKIYGTACLQYLCFSVTTKLNEILKMNIYHSYLEGYEQFSPCIYITIAFQKVINWQASSDFFFSWF